MKFSGAPMIAIVITLLVLGICAYRIFLQEQTREKQILLDTLNASLRALAPGVDFTISENKLTNETFTLDKRFIFMCLQNPDLNTLTFVAIHELAHVISGTYGHGPEFVKHFQELLNKAVALGIYRFVNYSKMPQKYCNMTINSTVINN